MESNLFSRSGLSLERLQTFARIAAAGGISHAAPGDSNRQSQYSRQLKELEEFFGSELIRRKRGAFALTQRGHELFRIVQTNFTALEDFARGCSDQNVEVNVGAGEGILQWLVTPNLPRLRIVQPNATFALFNLQTEEIINRLVDGRLDLGIVRQDAVRSPLRGARLGTIEHHLVVPASAQVSAKSSPWDILKRLPITLMHGSAITDAIEKECERLGITLDVCLRASSYLQMAEAVERFPCAAVLPTFATRRLTENGARVLDIKQLNSLKRPLAYAWDPTLSQIRPALLATTKSFITLVSASFSEK